MGILLEALKENKNIYFVSSDNKNLKILQPRVPDNYFTKNNYEDNTTKRICFSTSINGCLMGLSQNLKNKEFYVHQAIGDYHIIHPTILQVPDSKITKEVWLLKPTKIKVIGKILVYEDDKKPGHKFTYGDGKVAELYGWKYKWIEKK